MQWATTPCLQPLVPYGHCQGHCMEAQGVKCRSRYVAYGMTKLGYMDLRTQVRLFNEELAHLYGKLPPVGTRFEFESELSRTNIYTAVYPHAGKAAHDLLKVKDNLEEDTVLNLITSVGSDLSLVYVTNTPWIQCLYGVMRGLQQVTPGLTIVSELRG